MAWVRPKNPPPKPKGDPVDTLVPLLSYISNRRINSRSRSPTKHLPPPPSQIPISRDPILRSLQQAQAQAHHAEAEPIIVYEEEEDEDEEPDYQSQRHSTHHRSSRADRSYKQPSQHVVRHYERKPALAPPPPPPSPPKIVRQQPRVPSYERSRPAEIVRERVISQPLPYSTYTQRATSRAVSARWASATTPLDLR
ncbi:MAG: hypothetical protein LQ346_002810 [Caloplaca aetnensis]|nr:MAG: hypothetical protein LQ346_002810 [Caloplaca aetnensis]